MSMSSPEKKKRKNNEPSPTPTITSLPDDTLLNCLARVSRLYYPTLSLVSKKFRSLLASEDLYKVRSLLGHTESCIFVCIDSESDSNPIWFTLNRKPIQTLTNDDHISNKSKSKKKTSEYVLTKVPIFDSPPNAWGLVSVGSSIYKIDGSSNVSILDCTSHTWRHKATQGLPVELSSFSASVLDGKIYVAGCYKDEDDSLKNTFQVLNTKTLTWEPMPSPSIDDPDDFIYYNSACIDGKFHVKLNHEVIAYDSKEGKWDKVGPWMGHRMCSQYTCCVIENVLYSSSSGYLSWFDSKVRRWKALKGLVGLPKFPSHLTIVRLVDYSGKLVILWNEYSKRRPRYKNIWCAEISLEERQHEIWGNIEWCDYVLTFPKCYLIKKALAATI